MSTILRYNVNGPNVTRRGSALLASVSILTVLGVLIIVLLQGVVDSTKMTQRTVGDTRAETVSTSAIALGADFLWSGFERHIEDQGLEPQPWVFHDYLETLGIVDESAVAEPVGVDLLPMVNLPNSDLGADLDGVLVESLRVVRADEWNSTRLTFEVSAAVVAGRDVDSSRTQRSSYGAVYMVEPPNFDGLNFALLANNVNCILCHTTIDDAERFFNTDPNVYGEFDRVRVGSLESLQIRSDPESVLAGTLYLGGRAVLEDGSAISDWGALSLQSHALDGSGHQLQNAWGEPTLGPLVPADSDDPDPLENLYTNYLGAEEQVDGDLPTEFPSPFPDDGGFDYINGVATPELGGNRIVDQNEFQATVAGFSGTVAGGTIGLLDPSAVVANQSDLDTFLDGNTTNLGGVQSGNVYLHGTEDNPILLNGDVAIDGDLILSGYVKGEGTLMVSGNVFVPSDVQYLDANDSVGDRVFGTGADGSSNSLALGIGNNVVIGDPTHPSFGSGNRADGTPATDFNFILEELAIFNRGEWMKTQPTLPGETTIELVGYDEVEREVYDYLITEEQVEVEVREWVGTGVFRDVPIFERQVVGSREVPVFERRQNGTRSRPIYETIHHPADPPEPYGSPWSERVLVGHEEVPTYEDVQVGTTTEPIYDDVQIGTTSEEIRERIVTGTRLETVENRSRIEPPTIVIDQVPIYEPVTPEHVNALYAGPEFIPRYYNLDDGTPVPIFNKEGYYDPVAELWISEERAGGWDEHKLTLADPTDPSDPVLYGGGGQPEAVVSTVSPTSGWMSLELLSELMQRELGSRDDTRDIEIDATVYSANAILGVVPARNQPGVNGKLNVNGSLVAADVGLLAPKGTRVLYDRRGRDQLRIPDTSQLFMRQALWMPAAR